MLQILMWVVFIGQVIGIFSWGFKLALWSEKKEPKGMAKDQADARAIGGCLGHSLNLTGRLFALTVNLVAVITLFD